jgi:hypothetical protein
MTNPNDRNIVGVIVFLPTRFSELSRPESLAEINLEPKSLKELSDNLDAIRGDDEVISVDAHPTRQELDFLASQPATVLLFKCEDDNGQKDHSLERKTESRTHTRELGQAFYAIARDISLPRTCGIHCIAKMRKMSYHFSYVLVRDSIGCLGEIDSRKTAAPRTFTGQKLVRRLVSEPDQSSDNWVALERENQLFHERLLHKLHAGWLTGDDSWSLERFRD